MNRSGMIAKIQIEFPKTRPDLDPQTDAGELREARLEFCRDAAGLKTLLSLTALSDRELNLVLDRLSEARSRQTTDDRRPATASTRFNVRPLKPKPGLVALAATESAVGCGVPDDNRGPATVDGQPSAVVIHHLAGNEQAWAITRVFGYLEWDDKTRRNFVWKRFRRTNEKLLRPDQAKDLLYILFLCAASRDLKLKLGRDVKLTMEQKEGEIPAIKRRLGIDQRVERK